MAKNYKLLIFAGLSGIILALAFPGWGFNLGFLVWIGFVPLFYALNRGYHPFLTGFVAGLFYFLIIFRWFWSIYPLNTRGIQNDFASFTIIFLVYAISSAGMAAFWGLFGIIFNFQFSIFKKGKIPLILRLLVPAATFVLLEYARSYGFGILWAGSGTLFGPHWTLGNLAYALTNNSLALKLSSYVGIYGICFIVIVANFFFLKTLIRKNLRSAGIVILIVLLVTLGPKLLKQRSPSPDKEINFALIQTNQPTKILPTPKETLNAFKEQLDLLTRVAKEHPESQLIIFPEASDFFKNLSLFLTGAQIPNYFSNLFKEPKLIVAGARIIDTNDRAYSRVFALDTKKDIIGFYDKRLLTPEGEFLSYPTKFIVNLLSKTKVSEFGELRELGVGEKKVSTVNFRGQFNVAPIVCSEVLSPGLVRQTTEGSDVIVGMASYGIFHGSVILARQSLANARFRAAENQKPLLAASNMGLSYVTDSGGEIRSTTPNQGAQILTGSIALNSQKSWYNRVGDLPTILVSLVLIISFSLLTIFRRKKGGS